MNSDIDAITASVKELYARLHAGALAANDTIDFNSVKVSNTEDYVERIYTDRGEFNRAFGKFGDAYDIFRGFGEDSIVLDVGAHWGYSAVAMRHQKCRAKIVSIEAMSFNMPPLNRLKRIESGNYDCINIAANARNAVLTFYVPVVNGYAITGLASTGSTLDNYFAFLVADQVSHYPNEKPSGANDIRLAIVSVQSAPIDWILSHYLNDPRPVAAIKLDVEGHEAAALQGATKLFAEQKPLLMLENANRDRAAVEVMLSHGYFHTERSDGQLITQTGFSYANDGYWISRDRVAEYRAIGIFTGNVPTVEEASIPIEQKWNAQDGFA